MFKDFSTNRRLLLYFTFQTAFSLWALFYSHSITESEIRVLGKLTQDVLEHSINIEGALFKIQALPVGQILELVQGSTVMYSDPEALQKGVQKVITRRAEIDESLESVRASIHSQIVTETIQATTDSANRFNDAIDKASVLLLNGQKAEGVDVLMNRCTFLGASLEASIAKLQSACASEQSEKINEIRRLNSERVAGNKTHLLWLAASSLGTGISLYLLFKNRPPATSTDL